MYFERGHAKWLIFPLSITNATLIWWGILMRDFGIPLLEFSLFFINFYIVVAILFGKWDLTSRHGTYQTEERVVREISPLWNEINKKIDIQNKQLESIKLLIQKYEKVK
jgi:hypothetical protein